MREDGTKREFPIPAPAHMELVRLTHAVSLPTAELENARLRQELAVRAMIASLNLSGQRVAIDLATEHSNSNPPRGTGPDGLSATEDR